MKPFFLLMMGWAMAINPMLAQKQLPPSIEPYAVNWGYPVKQMLQAAGFEVPGPQPESKLIPFLENRSEKLQLDSTLYFEYGFQAGDSTPMFRNVYTYPEQDIQVVTEYFQDQGKWTPLSLTTMIHDDLGRLVDVFAQQYDEESGTYIPDSRILVFPHESSADLVDSFFVLAYSVEVGDWFRQLGTWNTFDDQDRLQEITSSVEIFQVPLVFIDRYSYTVEGHIRWIESFTLDGMEEIPAGRQEYWYTDQQLTSVVSLISDGISGFVAENKTEYTYTGTGKEQSISRYDWDLAKVDWKLKQVDSHGYDDEDRLILTERVALGETGIWVRHLDTYAYARDEYLASQAGHAYNQNDEKWVLEDKKYYYYQELVAVDPVDPVVADALFLYPNPTSGIVQVKLTGKIIVYVYSLSGQLISRIALPPGEKTINLSGLPAGVYQVRAKSDEDYFSGKLVIQ